MVKARHVAIGLAWLVILAACKKGHSDAGIGGQEPPAPKVFSVRSNQEVFGFNGQYRYSYCPSIVKEDDGTVHIFFCGTQSMVMVDNIYAVKFNADGSKAPEKIVLQPGDPGSWDDHHTCDPSVIGGDFIMGGNHYRYAMFYLGNRYGVYYNEIGLAFSNDLDSDNWIKYPHQLIRKTWDGDGDQVIGAAKAWGVGQPSAVSLDKKGKVLLTYTIGDLNGTRLAWSEVDLSDMDNYSPVVPSNVVREGLTKIDYTGTDIITDADVAVDIADGEMVMVRPVHPNTDASYPAYIEQAVELARMPLDDFLAGRGKWTPAIRITPTVSGFPRNHNPGIERDVYGGIGSWKDVFVYYTVSLAAPDVAPSGTMFAEWTYHIWKAEVALGE